MTGPGGVGKTRTSIEIASRMTDRPGGVWFIDLSTVSQTPDVPAAVLRALRVRDAAREGAPLSPARALAETLGDEPSLLLLDNCEHLTAGVREFLEELFAASTSITVLATSRNPIGIPGEEIVILPPLATTDPSTSNARSDSVELFLERARSRTPGFTVGAEGLERIREICRRLDGLPLAIELAAGQTRAFSLEETLERIRAGRSFLGTASTHSRHRSLSDLVDWSYRLLTPSEQSLLRRLSIFRGGFTLSACESVCGGWGGLEHWEICDLVGRLVDGSLIEPMDHGPGPGRYRLLETIRMFAAGKQGQDEHAGETALLESAYLDHLIAWTRVRPEEDVSTRAAWVARIEPDYPNALHGLELALATGRLHAAYHLADLLTYYWFQMGQWTAGLARLEQVVEARRLALESSGTGTARPSVPAETAAAAAGARAEARMLAQAAFLSSSLNRSERSASLLAEAIDAGGATGHSGTLAFVHQVAAMVTFRQGNLDAATSHSEDSLRWAREADDRGAAAAALGNLGVIESTRGRNEIALGYYEQHLRESRLMDDRAGEVTALANIAWCRWFLGEPQEALASFLETLQIVEEMRDAPNTSMVCSNLGVLTTMLGRYEEAERYLLRAARIRLGVGDEAGTASTLFSVARVAEKTGRAPLAASLVTGLIDRVGGQSYLVAPGQRVSLTDACEALAAELGAEEMHRAQIRATGMSLADLLAMAEAEARAMGDPTDRGSGLC
ncbi:MAG: tetratricopeptide repeat protein [Candidatus Eisenbacteria bacterium]